MIKCKLILALVLVQYYINAQVVNRGNRNVFVNIEDKSLKNQKVYLERVGYGDIDSFYCNKSINFQLPNDYSLAYSLRFDNIDEISTNIFFFTSLENDIHIKVDNINIVDNFSISGLRNEKWASLNKMLWDISLEENISRFNDTKPMYAIKKQHFDSLSFQIINQVFKEDQSLLLSFLYYHGKRTFKYTELSFSTISKIKELLKSLNKNLLQNPITKQVTDIYDNLSYLKEGNLIQDFALPSLIKDENVSTIDYRGKYLLVYFWKNGCVSLDETEKNLLNCFDKLKNKKFDIISVCCNYLAFKYDLDILNNERKNWFRRFPWKQCFIFKNHEGLRIFDIYNLVSYPKLILFSPEGKILSVNPSISQILQTLE